MATRKLLSFDSTQYGVITEVTSTDIGQIGQLSTSGVAGVGINLNGNTISNLGDPVNPTDAVNLRYLQMLAQGFSLLPSVNALSTSNISLTGLQSIDGISLGAGARVLVTGQTNPVQNGVYIVASGAWTRPKDSDDFFTGRIMGGLIVFIEGGTNHQSELWGVTGGNAGKVDTDGSQWTQLNGAFDIVAGNGLSKGASDGNTLSVNLASNSGLQFTSAALDTLLDPAGSVAKGTTGLKLSLNSNNTLASDSNGLRVLGLPSGFTVAGTVTTPAVSASALNTLTGGTGSIADGLHQHTNVLQSRAVVETHTAGSTALAAGDPVQWSGTNDVLQKADAAAVGTSQVIGIALTAIPANGTGPILKRGVGVGVFSGGTAGSPVYLAVGGGMSSAVVSQAGASIVRVGYAKNASDVDVMPVFVGQRSAG